MSSYMRLSRKSPSIVNIPLSYYVLDTFGTALIDQCVADSKDPVTGIVLLGTTTFSLFLYTFCSHLFLDHPSSNVPLSGPMAHSIVPIITHSDLFPLAAGLSHCLLQHPAHYLAQGSQGIFDDR